MYSKDTVWTSHDGRRNKIRDLEDTHLANLILFVSKRSWENDDILVSVLKEEAKDRGLTDIFLERAQIPHKARDGRWYMWDYDKNIPVKVG